MADHLGWVWRAFLDLNTDRQMGFAGSGPIMFASIDRYAIRYEIEGDEFDFLLRALRVMDAEWAEHQEKRRAKPG